MYTVAFLTLPSPLDTNLPRCARTAFRQNNSQRGPLCRGAALCYRHAPVITQRTRSEIGSSLGRFRQLLKLLADCGCSDNTIGHWTRWCPVPLIVALSILRPTRRVDNIGQLARMGVKHEGAFLRKMNICILFFMTL